MKRRLFLLLAALSIVIATGCPERKFKVQMTRTTAGHIQRTLTIWTEEDGNDTGPEEDVLAAATKAYGTSGAETQKRMRFEGEFAGELPADLAHETLTNHGFVSQVSTPLGSVVTYIERMPGEADPVKLLHEAERLADTVSRALSAGLAQVPELASEPNRLKGAQRFLGTQFKEDLIGALLLGWQVVVRMDCAQELEDADGPGVSLPERFLEAELARFVSFGVEHGYLDRDALILDDDALQRALVMGFIRRLAMEAGYPRSEPLPDYWKALFSSEGISKVFENGMMEIGVSEEEFSQMGKSLMPALFGKDTSGQVAFEGVDQPIRTNGKYEEANRRLAWECRAHQGCEPPQMVFALWTHPDEAWQTEHLGSVICSGEKLNDYIVWRAGLEDVQRAEWDAFVETLKPDNAADRLRAFRFAQAEKAEGAAVKNGEDGEEVTQGARLILGL